ncbi:MAG TPA: superoxide dismutase family protein, partial [Flavobacteriaceae bacterium]|nr:superoxide dismutase family protein [Flavobacteriaceae bacterium]
NEKQKEEQQIVPVVVEETSKTTSLELELESKSGSEAVGKAQFIERDGKVFFTAKIQGLTPGTHAIHLHEKSDCSADDATSTGGHWNPTFEQHGKWGDPDGFHRGDIGNFEANEEGLGTIEFETDLWCIGCGDEKKDIIGKAIIVHEAADDFVTQPTGDAGGRVSCGAVIQ